MGQGQSCISTALTHTSSGCPVAVPTACARVRKSETEKGLALAVAKAWHLYLGKLAHRVPVVLLGSRNTLLICRKDIMLGGGDRDSTSPSC